MSTPLLIIGNKNYSSWSLRPWIPMKVLEIDFDERLIPLFDENWDAAIAEVSPSRKVPCLIDGGLTVWETMAILEYLNDKHPYAGVWPDDIAARATARSAANEMHGGFGALREAMPMNTRKQLPGRGINDGSVADITRMQQLWNACRTAHGSGGDFLFGAFCAADAMFAPVVSRLVAYEVELDEVSQAYVDAMMALPAMQEWHTAGAAEPWIVSHDELD
ncbi:MAG: glutathione S-transferase family protein [Rhodospirillaceae bacterium]|jgi:glutathione S-transferase|nr:glutathione S-transferase family protein [Rhodospirillaceae bacterium]MBT6509266.1 glutathione S-transferase family protein [Rhodospirillaceae bacterium]MBT7615482.1 glutathione S-transferase family protein [Rhodospirillaceae bacterium]MBT7648404.1 glutathione S-transferase family protein [Rhodospirillaceae bacterium]